MDWEQEPLYQAARDCDIGRFRDLIRANKNDPVAMAVIKQGARDDGLHEGRREKFDELALRQAARERENQQPDPLQEIKEALAALTDRLHQQTAPADAVEGLRRDFQAVAQAVTHLAQLVEERLPPGDGMVSAGGFRNTGPL
jgi:hypothetical protein